VIRPPGAARLLPPTAAGGPPRGVCAGRETVAGAGPAAVGAGPQLAEGESTWSRSPTPPGGTRDRGQAVSLLKAQPCFAEKWRALIIFACATGLRPEEWIGLRWEDIDIKKRTCRINKVVIDGQLRTDRGKTDAAFRTIMLPGRAINALKSIPRPIQSDKLVFPAPQGGYINLDNWRERVCVPLHESGRVSDSVDLMV
jgi:hypothetical protein